MKIIDDSVIFECTGRELYANGGVIGLSPTFAVTEGWDGGFWSFESQIFAEPEDILSPEELSELADFMIQQWTNFKIKWCKWCKA